jgi:hypothetical protein
LTREISFGNLAQNAQIIDSRLQPAKGVSGESESKVEQQEVQLEVQTQPQSPSQDHLGIEKIVDVVIGNEPEKQVEHQE